MKMNRRIAFSIPALLALLGGAVAFALSPEEGKDKPAELKIGADAPDFTLKNTAGEEVSLSKYKDKVVVLHWVNKGCPWCKGSNDRVKALYSEWTGKGVVFLAIDSTHNNTAEDNIKYVADEKLPYKQLMDNDGTVGKKYGAKTTPHFFVINKGKLVYQGALDNDREGKMSKDEHRAYVKEALEAATAGKDVKLAETKPWGCTVKYKS